MYNMGTKLSSLIMSCDKSDWFPIETIKNLLLCGVLNLQKRVQHLSSCYIGASGSSQHAHLNPHGPVPGCTIRGYNINMKQALLQSCHCIQNYHCQLLSLGSTFVFWDLDSAWLKVVQDVELAPFSSAWDLYEEISQVQCYILQHPSTYPPSNEQETGTVVKGVKRAKDFSPTHTCLP
ncbi:Ent-kaurene oxidase, chloroplastic [Frankliniella fusca]|uniref:Ent-kaurene oxidase, chloroplastic n=1 Tax=Frankliniella fusca TaxID=407009 RepID=A0AAE1LD54_9NEOP|nr:Ent-kaurene oxidase, chloroplastic [Frankliniella fusca]